MSQDQLDEAFGHYVYGLTLSLFNDIKPIGQVQLISDLMATVLPSQRVDRAIRSKESYGDQFSTACMSLIEFGQRDARIILQSNVRNSTSARENAMPITAAELLGLQESESNQHEK